MTPAKPPPPGTPNFANRTLFQSDNLDVMRGINSATIDLIATDPPFNKGRDFHATPESLASGASFDDRWRWEEDVQQEWVDAIKDDFPATHGLISGVRSYAPDMAAYMCYMAVRLIEMQRVLKPMGSVYVHLDPTASHYIKGLMDAIFGRANFRNEIIWQRTSSHNRATKVWGPIHDVILFYSGGASLNPVRLPIEDGYVAKFFRHEDERGRFRIGDLTGPGVRRGDTGDPWRGISPTQRGRHWEVPHDRSLPDWFRHPPGYAKMTPRQRLDALDAGGLIHWPQRGGVPQFKRYLSIAKGRPIADVVTDISPLAAREAERVGYPTQKPLALYERIIAASSNPGDMVFDPFAGCATTCVAAERLGRQWIGADYWPNTAQVVLERLANSVPVPLQVEGWRDVVTHSLAPPIRTDEVDDAPTFQTPRGARPRVGTRWTHDAMKAMLLEKWGMRCWACTFNVQEAGYYHLDHINPRSDSNDNELHNRSILCSICNEMKGNRLTLTGVREARGFGRRNPHPFDIAAANEWARAKEREFDSGR